MAGVTLDDNVHKIISDMSYANHTTRKNMIAKMLEYVKEHEKLFIEEKFGERESL